MIDFIEGTIEYVGTNYIIIHSQNMGFKVEVPVSTLEKLGNIGDKVRLYTYLQIREKDLSLFGFFKREERELFLLILGVGGIGPKIGLSLLSMFSPEKLRTIIIDEDVNALTRVSGIGKKTAQRMILELKGTIEKGIGEGKEPISDMEDVYSALGALGYSRTEIKRAIDKVRDEISPKLEIDEIIRLLLKVMDKNG